MGEVAAPRHPGWGALAAIVLLAINLRTVIASLPPLLAGVRADLGLSAGAAGLLTTLPVVCFGAFAVVVPRLARRVALERVLVACAVTTAVAAALRGAGGVPALFAGSLLAGVAVAIGQSALPILIRSGFQGATGLLTGAYSMALPLGATVAGVTAVPLERALGDSWPRALAVWGVPAVLAAALWLPAALRPGTVVEGPRPRRLRSEPLAWSVAIFFGVQSLGFYAGLAWLPEILQDEGWNEGEAGALQGLSSLVSIAPAFLLPVLAARRRAGQAPYLVAITVIAAAGVTGLLLAPGAAPLWVTLIGIGQGGALGLGLILPVLRAADASVVASLTAMMLGIGYGLASLGPLLLGTVHDVTGGWAWPLVVLGALTLAQLAPGLHASAPRTLAAG